MSGCDINDMHSPKHAAPSRWLPRGCVAAAWLTTAASWLAAINNEPAAWWVAMTATALLLIVGVVSKRRLLNYRSRSLHDAGDGRGTGSVPVLRVTDAGGRALAGRGVDLRRRLLEARALRSEARTGWAAARRARTTPIDDE